LNLFPEPVPQQQGEPAAFAHYPTPGLMLLGTLPDNCIRGIRQCSNGRVYVVAGSNVYRVNPVTWQGTKLGSITPLKTTPVSMMDNGTTMLIVDGSTGGWTVNLSSDAFGNVTDPVVQAATATGTITLAANAVTYTPFNASVAGNVTSVAIQASAASAHATAAIYNADLSTVMATSNAITLTTATALNTFTFAIPPELQQGTTYVVALCQDGSATYATQAGSGASSGTTPYASFPATAPTGVTTGAAPLGGQVTIQPPTSGWAGADRVDYLDTYFLLNKPNTPQFYSSDSNATTFDPLYFANKESYSDYLSTIIVAKREIWLIGQETTEIWQNFGTADFPFGQVQSVFIDFGTQSKYSVARYDNSVFWLSADRQGQGIVLRGAGYQTQRISTFAIEHEISTYQRIDDAQGFVYLLGGHAFYVLTFPHADKTWAYDASTQLWHEWLWIDSNGDEHRHRANCYWPVNGIGVVGDWQNGNLYAIDQTVFTDNGAPIKRVRSFSHIANNAYRVFYKEFIADIETGTGGVSQGRQKLLDTTFTAADGTLLEDYSYSDDVNAVWTVVSGEAAISGDMLSAPAGSSALYQADPHLATADYVISFKMVPSTYGSVVPASDVYVIGRSDASGHGYQATLSSDGSQYWAKLQPLGGTSTSIALGTIASGWYLAKLIMEGVVIELQVQRSEDGLWLRSDGVWMDDADVVAVSMYDTTYGQPGVVKLGGDW